MKTKGFTAVEVMIVIAIVAIIAAIVVPALTADPKRREAMKQYREEKAKIEAYCDVNGKDLDWGWDNTIDEVEDLQTRRDLINKVKKKCGVPAEHASQEW